MRMPAGSLRMAGITMTLLPVLCYVFAAACFGADASMNAAIFPAAIAASLVAAPMLRRCTDVRAIAMSSAVALAITALSVVAAHFLSDYSSDGCWYHQEGIALMLDGWNPYRDSSPEGGAMIWTLHYAKSLEIIAAAIASATGSIEAGKAVNFIMAAAVVLLCYDFARRRGTRRRSAALFAAVAVGNPVLMVQLPTFYIDFTMYVYILLTIIFLLDAASGRSPAPYILIGAVTVLAIGTKFNIFFMQGMTLIFAAAWCFARRRRDMAARIVATGAAALVVGLLAAWHPYGGNLLNHGHPLYPLMGEGAQDIMTDNTPALYTGNRFADFVISIFYPQKPSYDGRINGFTPAMTLLLPLSIFAALRFKSVRRPLPLYIMGLSLASCFFFGQSWWARYNCQLWLLPLTALFCLYGQNGRMAIWCRRLMGGLAIAGAAFAFALTAPYAIYLNQWQRELYAMRRDRPARIIDLDPQTARHFAEAGVAVESIGDNELAAGSMVAATGYVWRGVFPMMEVSADEADSRLRPVGLPLHKNYSGNRLAPAER